MQGHLQSLIQILQCFTLIPLLNLNYLPNLFKVQVKNDILSKLKLTPMAGSISKWKQVWL